MLPVGQVPVGAEITPPLGVPPTMVHELSDVITAAGAEAVRTGHGGHVVPGVVVTELYGEAVVPSSSHKHLVNTVIEDV